ncbi:urea-proton symporter DUR3-like [Pecten maximus]|uniref:urea-proton symporter DUR3-like n=1 Tax=Pecten maximus TaxID=6579 RepID=UPI0014582040|nr:urea-proton symporter DUR3-like [Pecten maximus]
MSGFYDNCTTSLQDFQADQDSLLHPPLEKHEAALLMLLGFGGLSVTLALIQSALRRHVYHDQHNLDTAFDAGGKVTLSLTAVTVTSQMLWPADFLQSATVAIKTGLGGSLFFSIGIVLDILLFPMLSIHLKTRAPGAKTFLQIIYSRFGKVAHIYFCCVALLANLVTMTSLVLAGKASLHVLVKDSSDEFVILILAVLFGSYCLIGGLGTTFYISYFNTALTFVTLLVFVVMVSYTDKGPNQDYATNEAMYEAMTCIAGPDGNHENSLMTFRSRSGIIYGIMLFFMATSLSFCDQANWQSRIAAKPAQGVLGFFIAAYVWFAIPTTIALTSAMTYMSLGYQNGTHLLTASDIDSGYITPFVMETLMGTQGGYLLITMVTMALMSTGSGEVMAVSSIIVYDIYRTHVNPYRKSSSPTSCLLCGKEKVSAKDSAKTELCVCKPFEDCRDCKEDVKIRMSGSKNFGVQYGCVKHGLYRHYEDLLIHYKSWCIVWVTIGVVPYGLLVMASGVNLNWAVFTLQALLSPFLIPLLLTIAWSKSTAPGVIAGSASGLIAAITGILVVGETAHKDGLRNFMVNTSTEYSLLAGIGAGVITSSVVTIVISLCTNNIRSTEDAGKEWEKTLSIDNPLNPWRNLYKEELSKIPHDTKITGKNMAAIFRPAKWVAYIGGGISVLFFLVVFPAVMLSFEVLTYEQFSGWLTACQVWCMVGAAFAIIAPPAEEIIQVWRQHRKNDTEKVKNAYENTAYDEHL